MIRIFAFLLFLSTPAFAQQFPAAYSVTDVVAGDTLNIRAEPNASSAIVGSYPPYAVNIEILRTNNDGTWGRVGLPEGNGWVSMRFVERSNHNDPNAFPRPMVCGGVETSWNLGVYPGGDEYNAPDTGRRDLTMLSEAAAPNGYIATFEEGPTLNRTIIVRRARCSDGMSDRIYGWRAMLFNEAPDGNALQHGCCTLDTN